MKIHSARRRPLPATSGHFKNFAKVRRQLYYSTAEVLTLCCGAGGAGAVGHGGPGGLRPAAAPLLPRHRRHPPLLLRVQPRQSREHSRALGARGQALLPHGARAAGRPEEGPAAVRGGGAAAAGDQAAPRHQGGGPAHDGEDRSCRVLRVLLQNKGKHSVLRLLDPPKNIYRKELENYLRLLREQQWFPKSDQMEEIVVNVYYFDYSIHHINSMRSYTCFIQYMHIQT